MRAASVAPTGMLNIGSGSAFKTLAAHVTRPFAARMTGSLVMPMTKPRSGCGAASCGGKIFVWEAKTGRGSGSGECYDFTKRLWAPVADIPIRAQVFNRICAASADTIIAVLSGIPFIYSILTNKWTQTKWILPCDNCKSLNINNPRGFLTVVSAGNLGIHTPWFLPIEMILCEEREKVRLAWIRGLNRKLFFTV